MSERAARYELTGLQKTYLETVRERMTPDDFMPALMGELDEQGVVRLVPPRWTEQVARILADDLWKHCVEPQGEVDAS